MVWWYESCPTSSKSLCLPETRRHFCELATRKLTGWAFPRKISLNWFMPALVNIRVGSSLITMGAEGTMRCCLDSKKSRKLFLISEAVIYKICPKICSAEIKVTSYTSYLLMTVTHKSTYYSMFLHNKKKIILSNNP